MLRKLFLASDGSVNALRAAEFSAGLAAVIKNTDVLDRTLAVFKSHPNVEGVTAAGNPAQQIVDFAREGGFDQIVVK